MKNTNKTIIWGYQRSSVASPSPDKRKKTVAALSSCQRGGVKRLIVDEKARAGIELIFQAAARGELGRLFAHSPDRFSRVPQKMNDILRRLRASGVRVQFASQ